jgi:hypothetical protein
VPIDVQCSTCGKRLRAPDEQAGRKGRCPACKAEISVPLHASAVGASQLDLVPAAAPSSPPPVPSSLPKTRSASVASDYTGSNYSIPSTAEADATLEPKHWFALGAALDLTKNALLLSWISCGVIGLALVGNILASKSMGDDVIVSRAITLLESWGKAGALIGWTILFSGWLMSRVAWPAAERRWLQISVWITVLLFFVLLILLTLHVFGIGDESSGVKTALTKTVPTIVFGLATASALVAFSYFLTALEERMGNEHRKQEPLVRAIIIGVLMAWCIVANLFIEPNTAGKAWLVVITTLVTFVTQFLWLWMLNVHVASHLRVNQAWKRL